MMIMILKMNEDNNEYADNKQDDETENDEKQEMNKSHKHAKTL